MGGSIPPTPSSTKSAICNCSHRGDARVSWTRLNRERAADMEARGLMTAAGRGAIAAAKSTGWWTILDQVEDLEEPSDLQAALDLDTQARSNWDSFPPSARKQMLWWIVQCRSRRNTGRSNRPYCQQCGHRSTCPRLIRDSTASGMKAGHYLSEGSPSDRNKSTRPAEAGRVDSVLAGLTYVRMRITRRSRARTSALAFVCVECVAEVALSCAITVRYAHLR